MDATWKSRSGNVAGAVRKRLAARKSAPRRCTGLHCGSDRRGRWQKSVQPMGGTGRRSRIRAQLHDFITGRAWGYGAA